MYVCFFKFVLPTGVINHNRTKLLKQTSISEHILIQNWGKENFLRLDLSEYLEYGRRESLEEESQDNDD